METITIRTNLAKHMLLVLGGLLLVGASVLLLTLDPDRVNSHFLARFKYLVKPVAVAGLLFFTPASLYIAYRLVARRVVLVIAEDGFTDTTTMSSVGFVPWSKVSGVRICTVVSETFVGVDVKDDAHALPGRLPWLKRMMTAGNTKLGYPPIMINLNAVDMKPAQLLETMNRYLAHSATK